MARRSCCPARVRITAPRSTAAIVVPSHTRSPTRNTRITPLGSSRMVAWLLGGVGRGGGGQQRQRQLGLGDAVLGDLSVGTAVASRAASPRSPAPPRPPGAASMAASGSAVESPHPSSRPRQTGSSAGRGVTLQSEARSAPARGGWISAVSLASPADRAADSLSAAAQRPERQPGTRASRPLTGPSAFGTCPSAPPWRARARPSPARAARGSGPAATGSVVSSA